MSQELPEKGATPEASKPGAALKQELCLKSVSQELPEKRSYA